MKKKNIFILMILLLVILLIVIISILTIIKKNIINATPEYEETTEIQIDNRLKNVSNRNNYYIVEKCINKFYTYYTSMFENNGAIERVYNMLDTEYINTREITQDNILNKLNKIEAQASAEMNITKMYECEQTQKVVIYFVKGTFRNKGSSNILDFAIMVKLDDYNKTFSIFLQDYLEGNYSNIKLGEKIELNYTEQIQENKYNSYMYRAIDDETYVADIIESYRQKMLYNPEVAYKYLDEEYRIKRFPTLENFKKYINDNLRKIIVMNVSKYQKNKNGDNLQYICVDSNNNSYIINEISPMNCTFILDTYTLDLPEFLQKYTVSDSETKVCLNIEKIKEAINNKDFQYVYNKTDETFRNNNFKSYTDFENYLKLNLFEENIFEYKQVQQQANVYVVTVSVKNKKNENDEEKKMNIIMKLEENTDYYISFSFQ